MMTYTINRNEQYSSIEITFSEKPADEIRDRLKALKFRWHNLKKVWYGYTTEEEARAAIEGTAAQIATAKPVKPAAKVNKFGVKVGDLFSASWGYEQTNNDFFQVIALVGETSVRVREVYPICEDSAPISGMSEERIFSTDTNGKLLPPAPHSVFINDQENGDLKRLKSYAADGKSNPQFCLSNFCDAHLCTTETTEVYESWYF